MSQASGEAMNGVVKERPILFSAPMVRATIPPLEQKNKTRRTQGLDAINAAPNDWRLHDMSVSVKTLKQQATFKNILTGLFVTVECPYGRAGDHLWVRETWRCGGPCAGLKIRELDELNDDEHLKYRADCDDGVDRWFPAIHMPRWASRILLEVVSVRIERLQDISEQDAVAEGVARDSGGWFDYIDSVTSFCVSARQSFRSLWGSINGTDSWDANPWVWVVEFRRLRCA